MKEERGTWLWVFGLIAMEQGIKSGIYYNLMDAEVPILPPFLYFNPLFNRDYSWFNSMLQLGIGKWVHIVFVFMACVFIFLFYRYLLSLTNNHQTIRLPFVFLFSGAMCSLIDKVFWDGSLDYIQLKSFFTFDLKDLYIDAFIVILLFYVVTGNKFLKQLEKDKNFGRDFIKFLSRKKRGDESPLS